MFLPNLKQLPSKKKSDHVFTMPQTRGQLGLPLHFVNVLQHGTQGNEL
jgi:hypothetical protein